MTCGGQGSSGCKWSPVDERETDAGDAMRLTKEEQRFDAAIVGLIEILDEFLSLVRISQMWRAQGIQLPRKRRGRKK